ncbi:predicted protein [Nematostella vectensis]|uniref:Coiled-coil protein 142 C-terminal domain-containing protein n=1 Tax=Nematostella vectensis TaxID=45351 RepID=A7RLI0_NEMVE|nr:uncharacterized protein LOC5519881 [Nematostella vectensis]EDO47694.1 predicted protein [Nematostella vectensis]|eukprot:XP_001639757.1 predicted protein [Nematostella vectensis]
MDERGPSGKIHLSPLNLEFTAPAGSRLHSDQTLARYHSSSTLDSEEVDNAFALEGRFQHVGQKTCMCSIGPEEGSLFGHFEAGALLCSNVRQIDQEMHQRIGLVLMKDCLVRLRSSCALITDLEKTTESYVAYLKDLRLRRPEKTKEFIFKGGRFQELCQEARTHLTFWSIFRERFSAEPKIRSALLKMQEHFGYIHAALGRGILGLTAWLGSILFCVLQIAHHLQWRLTKNLYRDISTAIEDFNRLCEYSNDVLQDNEIICNLEQFEDFEHSLVCEKYGICAPMTVNKNALSGRNICPITLNKLLNEIADGRACTLAGLVSEFLCQHEEIRRGLEADLTSKWEWEDLNLTATHRHDPKVSNTSSLPNGIITVMSKANTPVINLPKESPILTFDSIEHKFIVQLMVHLATSTTLMVSNTADRRLFMHRSLPQQGLCSDNCNEQGVDDQGVTSQGDQESNHGILKHSNSVTSPRQNKRVQWHESLDIDTKAQISSYYMDRLWDHLGPALCNLLHGLRRRRNTYNPLGSVILWPNSLVLVALSLLESLHKSGSLPQSGTVALQLVSRDLHSHLSRLTWDLGFCDLLGTSLKDKCIPDENTKPGYLSSKTLSKLAALLQPLKSMFDCSYYWKDRLSNHDTFRSHSLALIPLVTRLQSVLSFSTNWIDSKLYHLLSSWSLTSYFTVLHWDLPLFLDMASKTVSAVKPLCLGQGGNLSWGSLPILLEELQGSLLRLESISKKYESLFSGDLAKMSKEFFQEAMPIGRSWKKSRHSGVPCQPNSYVEHAVMQILEPVFRSSAHLREESKMSLMIQATVTMMDTWSRHILNSEIVFSYFGAQQLQLDFSYVKYWISSDASGLEEDAKSELLSLDSFRHLDAAIQLLMLQPKKKKQSDELDVELESNISAVSTSSVLSSLSGVDADTFMTDVLMDKTIPNKQKWLDLRLRGGKSKKGLLPFCLKVQEMD